jgi:hypothetical protein
MFRSNELTGTTEQNIDALINSLSPGSTFLTNLSYLKTLTETYNAPFWMSETNSVAGSLAGVTNSFASAIWALDYLYTLASYNVKGANFHSGGNSSSYAPIYRVSAANGTYAIGSIYYGLLAFTDGALNQRLLAVTPMGSTANPRTSCYATASDDGRTVKLTIINKDFTRPITASVRVPGINISTASYQTLRPQTNMYDAAAATYYANAQITADGSFTKGAPTTLPVTNATQFAVSVAPMTAVVVTLTTSAPSFYTVKTGSWDDTSVWSGNRVPTKTDVIVIKHAVSVPANAVVHAQRVVFQSGVKLNLGQNARLQMNL